MLDEQESGFGDDCCFKPNLIYQRQSSWCLYVHIQQDRRTARNWHCAAARCWYPNLDGHRIVVKILSQSRGSFPLAAILGFLRNFRSIWPHEKTLINIIWYDLAFGIHTAQELLIVTMTGFPHWLASRPPCAATRRRQAMSQRQVLCIDDPMELGRSLGASFQGFERLPGGKASGSYGKAPFLTNLVMISEYLLILLWFDGI